MIERTLYSIKSKCPGGCEYCFARWDEQAPDFPLIDTELTINRAKKHIVYPCCDGDFDANDLLFRYLGELSTRKNLIVSISTKQLLSSNTLTFLKRIHNSLRENAGFLKLSVSITTKSMAEEIEPRVASYQERLNMLHRIESIGIPFAVTLKPILPFIPLEEYESMIEDTAFAGRYLIGSLYVHPATTFFKKCIDGKYVTTPRKVNWVNEQCEWLSVSQDWRLELLQQYLTARHLRGFFSDVDLIEDLCMSQQL